LLPIALLIVGVVAVTAGLLLMPVRYDFGALYVVGSICVSLGLILEGLDSGGSSRGVLIDFGVGFLLIFIGALAGNTFLAGGVIGVGIGFVGAGMLIFLLGKRGQPAVGGVI
jgi:hypothetical protein